MQKVKSKSKIKKDSEGGEKKMEEGQHLKVPLDAKSLLKMHISHAILQHLDLMK